MRDHEQIRKISAWFRKADEKSLKEFKLLHHANLELYLDAGRAVNTMSRLPVTRTEHGIATAIGELHNAMYTVAMAICGVRGIQVTQELFILGRYGEIPEVTDYLHKFIEYVEQKERNYERLSNNE